MDKSGEGGGGGSGDSRDGGPSPSTSSGPSIGCGSAGTSSSSGSASAVVSPLTLNVTTTTGGSFSVVVDGENSVENLKKIISKKLKVSKDRICLLHRERELHDGSLRDNGLMDGSKLILTPNVETGLLAQRAENTVMQALESLNDNQVNDFLSGKSPLNLSVRLGDHMMLIQLQLSTLNPSSASGSRSKTHKSRTAIAAGGSSSSAAGSSGSSGVASGSRRTAGSIPIGFRRVAESRSLVERVGESQTLTRQDIENIHSIVKNLAESDNPTVASVVESEVSGEQSPIKSLSNLVSSSINSNNNPELTCTDPISANLTSCLCKRLDSNDNHSCESNCRAAPEPQPSTSSSSTLHRTAQNPIARHKSKLQTLKKHISFESSSSAVTRIEPDQVHPVSAPSSPQPGPSRVLDPNSVVENPALAEASRNLTQTLRKLSKRVFTTSSGSSKTSSDSQASAAQAAQDAAAAAARSSAVNSGAVIESMKHHGKGIYSGTFSGTLNPALQDKFGRPKRDISTIIHILNDLLSAAPQCARSGTKIYFEPSSTAAAAAAGGTQSGSGSGSAGQGSSGSGGAATFTTPVAAPSPRLVSRCMPTPIQTKKFPSNGTITSHHHHQQRVATAAASPPTSPAVKIQCKCGHPLLTPTGPASQCQRCASELENSKTKSKLDSLRLIMQQKKERREARKQKCAPYPVATPTLVLPPLAAASGSIRQAAPQPAPAPIPSSSPSAAAIVGEPSSSSSQAAGSATATATATAAATTEAAAAAAQSHQLVEEVDTVA